MNPYTLIWPQFGAAIETLEQALQAVPDDLWQRDRRFAYMLYHALFFTDLYLSGSKDGFAPPAPFTWNELSFEPHTYEPYSKAQLQTYLDFCRSKAKKALKDLSLAGALARCGFPRIDGTVVECYLYNMRHVQHHAAQLNLLLRQTTDSSPRWVFKASA